MRSSARTRSSTQRAIGPMTTKSTAKGKAGRPGGRWPREATSPWVGLCAETPQKCAGTRKEPPMSEPNDKGPKPAASAADDPPEEPPGVRVLSQGLLVVP